MLLAHEHIARVSTAVHSVCADHICAGQKVQLYSLLAGSSSQYNADMLSTACWQNTTFRVSASRYICALHALNKLATHNKKQQMSFKLCAFLF